MTKPEAPRRIEPELRGIFLPISLRRFSHRRGSATCLCTLRERSALRLSCSVHASTRCLSGEFSLQRARRETTTERSVMPQSGREGARVPVPGRDREKVTRRGAAIINFRVISGRRRLGGGGYLGWTIVTRSADIGSTTKYGSCYYSELMTLLSLRLRFTIFRSLRFLPPDPNMCVLCRFDSRFREAGRDSRASIGIPIGMGDQSR